MFNQINSSNQSQDEENISQNLESPQIFQEENQFFPKNKEENNNKKAIENFSGQHSKAKRQKKLKKKTTNTNENVNSTLDISSSIAFQKICNLTAQENNTFFNDSQLNNSSSKTRNISDKHPTEPESMADFISSSFQAFQNPDDQRKKQGRIANHIKKLGCLEATHSNTKKDNLQLKAQKTYFEIGRQFIGKLIDSEGSESPSNTQLKKISTRFTNDIWNKSFGKFDETLYEIYTLHGTQRKQKKDSQEDTENYNKSIFKSILQRSGFCETKKILKMTFREFLRLIKDRNYLEFGLKESTMKFLPTIDFLVENEKNNEINRIKKLKEINVEQALSKINELSVKYRDNLINFENNLRERKGRKPKKYKNGF